jgi:hypothetical protein
VQQSGSILYTATVVEVAAGNYTVSENDVFGYTEGSWSCDNNSSGGPYNNGSATVLPGQTTTCSITNDDDPGTLVVQKTVINDDGGLLTVADFNITTAGTLTFGTGEAGTVPGSLVYTATIAGLSAADYDLAELDVTGYSEGSWSCSNGAGGAFGSGSATVANGATTTCSITNDDGQWREPGWHGWAG